MYRFPGNFFPITVFALAFMLAACRTADRPPADQDGVFDPQEQPPTDVAAPPDPDEQLTHDPYRAERTNGSQHARIALGLDAFDPPAVELRRGVAAELTFVRTHPDACAEEIRIPDFEIITAPLVLNQPVTVSLKADQSGVYPFRCGTGRPSGRLIVPR